MKEVSISHFFGTSTGTGAENRDFFLTGHKFTHLLKSEPHSSRRGENFDFLVF